MGEKKEQHSTTALFNIDMHCEGCAIKIRNSARQIQGVERVRAKWEANKLIVMGTFDPSKLQEKLAHKTNKKIVIVSSESNKENDLKKPDKKTDENNSQHQETPVTTTTLKLELHCTGCIARIYKVVSTTKGVEDVAIERQKDLVIVKGKMEVKALIQSLEEKLKRKVAVVVPKTDVKDDGSESSTGDDGGGVVVTDANRLDYVAVSVPEYGYGYGYAYGYGFEYGYGYGNGGFVEHLPSPQMFSDDNPNACSVM